MCNSKSIEKLIKSAAKGRESIRDLKLRIIIPRKNSAVGSVHTGSQQATSTTNIYIMQEPVNRYIIGTNYNVSRMLCMIEHQPNVHTRKQMTT